MTGRRDLEEVEGVWVIEGICDSLPITSDPEVKTDETSPYNIAAFSLLFYFTEVS